MMNLRQRLAGRGCYNRAGHQWRPPLLPDLPNTSKCDWPSVGAVDVPRQPFALGILGPFEKTGCRDEATTLPACSAKGGLLCERFRPRVNQQRSICRALVPMRQESPTHWAQSPVCAIRGDHSDLVRGADIEVRRVRQIIRRCRCKKLRHRLRRQGQGKPSTHRRNLAAQTATDQQIDLTTSATQGGLTEDNQ